MSKSMKRHSPLPGDLRWSYSLKRYVSTCQTCEMRIEERGLKWRHVSDPAGMVQRKESES